MKIHSKHQKNPILFCLKITIFHRKKIFKKCEETCLETGIFWVDLILITSIFERNTEKS